MDNHATISFMMNLQATQLYLETNYLARSIDSHNSNEVLDKVAYVISIILHTPDTRGFENSEQCTNLMVIA